MKKRTTECTENTEAPNKKNLSVKSVYSVVPGIS